MKTITKLARWLRGWGIVGKVRGETIRLSGEKMIVHITGDDVPGRLIAQADDESAWINVVASPTRDGDYACTIRLHELVTLLTIKGMAEQMLAKHLRG